MNKFLAIKYNKYYWITEAFNDGLKDVPIIFLLENMPSYAIRGCNYTFTIHPSSEDCKYWKLSICDWYGERSSVEILKCTTSPYTTMEEAIYFMFRDWISFISDRHPNDEYTIKLFNKIVDEWLPDLKRETWYNIEE